MMSPSLVFLVGIEIPLLSDIHPEPVLSDLVRNTLFDLANHQALLVHRSDHLLHKIDLDVLHTLTYVIGGAELPIGVATTLLGIGLWGGAPSALTLNLNGSLSLGTNDDSVAKSRSGGPSVDGSL